MVQGRIRFSSLKSLALTSAVRIIILSIELVDSNIVPSFICHLWLYKKWGS